MILSIYSVSNKRNVSTGKGLYLKPKVTTILTLGIFDNVFV